MFGEMDKKIFWLGHAGFLIKDDKNIYIDPYKISNGLPKADIILITHSHFDHCSIDDLEKIVKNDTIVIAPPDCQSRVTKLKIKEVVPIHPGKSVEIGNINIKAVPAYNTNKSFHPKENEWVGYVIEIKGIRIYHAGDTDFIPEMKELGDIDIALLPVSGTYVMDPEEAARATEIINPKMVIPMHYGTIIGGEAERDKFIELVKEKVKTFIPEKI